MGVPTHAMDIQAEQARRGIARLGAVNLFYMAGAPIPAAVAERFVAQGVRPQNIYGMTENSSPQYTHPTDHENTICPPCGRGGARHAVRTLGSASSRAPVCQRVSISVVARS